jgi:hypothetical protein
MAWTPGSFMSASRKTDSGVSARFTAMLMSMGNQPYFGRKTSTQRW